VNPAGTGLCSEQSDECEYNEHSKCDGYMVCHDGWPDHHCYCYCHIRP
jgi:hypothetical protein